MQIWYLVLCKECDLMLPMPFKNESEMFEWKKNHENIHYKVLALVQTECGIYEYVGVGVNK